jgi:hypothetical protein
MSDIKRRKQNRDAQRRFREKQAREAQLSQQKFERLTSRYEALLAENESLKSEQLARSDYVRRTPDDPLKEWLSPVGVQWEFDSLPPSHAANFTNELDGELFSLDTQNVQLRTPCVNDIEQNAAPTSSMESAAFSFDEMHDTILPSIEQHHDYALEPAVAETRVAPCPVVETQITPYPVVETQVAPYPVVETQIAPYPVAEAGSAQIPASMSLVNPPGGVGYGLCGATSFPAPLPALSAGLSDSFTNSVPKMDLVQAVLQMAFAQERLALIDLERARLRVCEC